MDTGVMGSVAVHLVELFEDDGGRWSSSSSILSSFDVSGSCCAAGVTSDGAITTTVFRDSKAWQKHKSGSSISYSCVVFTYGLLAAGAACLNAALLDAMLHYDVLY
ncbi:hypothetical protein E2C01_001379 [Portunus trituberculatus]|uniref:Uncharacterized protein n=1 Tax=Portunus trituberculatus TaxID=210409 RepID=A0A5B7CH16_PORTR|nr:hypothetical protein [Portunus trituberculatus]